MDGQGTRCARCGALGGAGQFCGSCGARLDTTAGPQGAAFDDTSTRDRIRPVPAEPVDPGPLFRDEVETPSEQTRRVPAHAATDRPFDADPFDADPVDADPVGAGPVRGGPVYAEPGPRRYPGAGLWIGAAAGMVTVLVLGAFLLLRDGGGDDASPDPPMIPQTQSATRSSAATSSPTSSAPTSPTTSAAARDAKPADVAGLSQASAPRHAPAGVDFAGRTVTYVAPNMVDGVVDTCWRTPGDATGIVLTFRLDQPTRITKVGLVNGYAKTAVAGGRRYDWYQGDRRVRAVDWVFDDGSTVSQQFSDTRAMQTRRVPPVTTSTVRVRITSVSAPGRGPAARNDTAVSEVSLVGAAS